MLWGWQRQGERAVAGVPWRFEAAVLQHHQQQEGRAVAVVGVPRRFCGCDVHFPRFGLSRNTEFETLK